MNREQLKEQLSSLGVPSQVYSLSGGLPNEQYVLSQEPNEQWAVYYSERGQRSNLRIFDSEENAVQYFLDTILHDHVIKASMLPKKEVSDQDEYRKNDLFE